jgi:transketolase
VLCTQFVRFDPLAPDWPDRDPFVVSNGHGCMLLYGLVHLTGYPDMTLDELKRFRQLGSRPAGHPERGHASGIEVTTGPLGQGFGNSVGMAIAERLLAAEFGDDIVDHHTYVFCGDGCLMEGISHEAASLAGHLRLNKLIVLYDDNSISIDGPTELAFSDDPVLRFRAYGWAAERIDRHDHEAVADAVRRAQQSDRPNLIACGTIIAFGAPTKPGTAAPNGAPLGADEIAGARERLGWSGPPFVIPEDVQSEWRAAGSRGAPIRSAWEARLRALPPKRRPTHQPVEHLAALRAMPRPADPVETAESWAVALRRRDAPSLLALTRQALPLLRSETGSENRSARGAYVLAEADGPRRITLLATGSRCRSRWPRRTRWPRMGFAPPWSRCLAGSFLSRRPRNTRTQFSARHHGLPSRPLSNWAGSAGLGRAAPLSA